MQFTSEVEWTLFDFAVFAGLLGSALVLLEIAMRIMVRRNGLALAVSLIAIGFVLVWGLLATA